MKTWQGIRSDTMATASDGAFYALNPTFAIEGELGRRAGMALFTPQSGVAITNFWNVTTGYFVAFATDTGTLEVEAAT